VQAEKLFVNRAWGVSGKMEKMEKQKAKNKK
jgi:hypothetical protein